MPTHVYKPRSDYSVDARKLITLRDAIALDVGSSPAWRQECRELALRLATLLLNRQTITTIKKGSSK